LIEARDFNPPTDRKLPPVTTRDQRRKAFSGAGTIPEQ